MKRLRVGVVGTGALGRHHARIYSALDTTELVGVADTSAERGPAVAESCRTRWFQDFRSLFGEVDAVSIAVPTVAHQAVASEFLKRRIAVLVEKPLAANVAEAAALVTTAERTRTTLQVGHVERFNPAAQVARRLAESPRYIRAERMSPYAFRSTDIGVVLDVMIHDIDLVFDLAGSPLVDVEAFGVSILGENEDCVQARLRFENGCVADLSASRVHPTSRRSMQIWSKAGCVSVDLMSREVVHFTPTDRLLKGESPLARARRPGADIEQLKGEIFGQYLHVERPEVPAADALTAELSSFADCVIHGRQPVVDGRAALAAMQAADRILQSVAAHRWNGREAGPIGPFLTAPAANRPAAA
ncbi:MAG TPA: Gfo/Idh/MocA family oxidoreductase [Planctomycetaceae bacterium]|jgi:predicted dehydrogenase|nr:Gfo/Idh/MocA family oxidoreductase [Planctomycetaceae bacterium]